MATPAQNPAMQAMQAQSDMNNLTNLPPGIRAFVSDVRRAERILAQSEAAEYGVRDRLSSLYAEVADLDRELDEIARVVAEELSPTVIESCNTDADDEKSGVTVDLTQFIFEIHGDLHIDRAPLFEVLKANGQRLKFPRSLFEFEEADDDHCRRHSKKREFCRLMKSFSNGEMKLGKVIRVWCALRVEFAAKKREVRVTEIAFTNPSRDRSLIFISEEATQFAVDSGSTREHFVSSKQLFHYLRWTIKMQQIDGFYKVLRIEKHGRDPFEVVLFNTELHRRCELGYDCDPSDINALDTLFIVGVQNDRVSLKSPKWKMDAFASAREIREKYGISAEWLSVGSRGISRAFSSINRQRHYRQMAVAGWLRRESSSGSETSDSASAVLASAVSLRWVFYFFDPFSRMPKYLQGTTSVTQGVYGKLQQIKTLQKKEQHRLSPREMRVSTPDFCKFISAAMGNELMRIVSFDKHKTAYHIDLLLPVRLATDRDGGENWIGIIFRDNKPISICIDCNDIRTKSKLFDALCDVDRFAWLRNRLTRLTVTTHVQTHRVRAQFLGYGQQIQHAPYQPIQSMAHAHYSPQPLQCVRQNSPPRPALGLSHSNGYSQDRHSHFRHGHGQARHYAHSPSPSPPRFAQAAQRARGREYVQHQPRNYSPRHAAQQQQQRIQRNYGRQHMAQRPY